MKTDILTVSPNIQGNISNCEIQTIKTNTDYKPYKFIYTNTYKVINKCDNTVLSTYNESGAGFWIWVILGIVIIWGLYKIDNSY